MLFEQCSHQLLLVSKLCVFPNQSLLDNHSCFLIGLLLTHTYDIPASSFTMLVNYYCQSNRVGGISAVPFHLLWCPTALFLLLRSWNGFNVFINIVVLMGNFQTLFVICLVKTVFVSGWSLVNLHRGRLVKKAIRYTHFQLGVNNYLSHISLASFDLFMCSFFLGRTWNWSPWAHWSGRSTRTKGDWLSCEFNFPYSTIQKRRGCQHKPKHS